LKFAVFWTHRSNIVVFHSQRRIGAGSPNEALSGYRVLERRAKKNAESFEALALPVFFAHGLFLSACAIKKRLRGKDQNIVFDLVDWIWNGRPFAAGTRCDR